MHKTTVNLPKDLWVPIRLMAEREGRSVSEVVKELLGEALEARRPTGDFSFIGSGESDVDDLAINAEKYLRELAWEHEERERKR